MREDCRYYLPCGYGRGKVKILCNGKIARGNNIEEAWVNKAQSYSKNTNEHVLLAVLLLGI